MFNFVLHVGRLPLNYNQGGLHDFGYLDDKTCGALVSRIHMLEKAEKGGRKHVAVSCCAGLTTVTSLRNIGRSFSVVSHPRFHPSATFPIFFAPLLCTFRSFITARVFPPTPGCMLDLWTASCIHVTTQFVYLLMHGSDISYCLDPCHSRLLTAFTRSGVYAPVPRQAFCLIHIGWELKTSGPPGFANHWTELCEPHSGVEQLLWFISLHDSIYGTEFFKKILSIKKLFLIQTFELT